MSTKSKMYQVMEVTIQPGSEPQEKLIRNPMPKLQAEELRDKLNGKNESFDPNKVISYLIQPSN